MVGGGESNVGSVLAWDRRGIKRADAIQACKEGRETFSEGASGSSRRKSHDFRYGLHAACFVVLVRLMHCDLDDPLRPKHAQKVSNLV